MNEDRPTPLTVVAWMLVFAGGLLIVDALMTQLLWNVITAPVFGFSRISFKGALAGFITAGAAGFLVQIIALALAGVRKSG